VDSEPYPDSLSGLLFLYNLAVIGPEILMYSCIILVFLIISALMSGSEVAFFSIGHNDIENLQKENNNSKNRILKLLDKPHYLLSTILIANNFVNIGIVLSANFIFNAILPESLPDWARFLITVVLVTFILVLFGEIAPKVYASNAKKSKMILAKFMSGPLLFLRAMLYPISWLLVNSSKFIENRLAQRAQNGNLNIVSHKEIEHAIELTVKDTEFAKEDIGLLKSIVQFGNINVKNIMKARINVVALDKDSSFSEVMQTIRKSNYSRIPVFEETFDKIAGIIHSKDLLEHFDKPENYDWHKLIRNAFFVPESKKIDDLFGDFQSKRTHIAIVVDEYGGTSGIVTLEDILEEIVGEINDEFDEPEDMGYSKVNDHTFVFEGRTSLIDVAKVLNLDPSFFDEDKEGSETIGGLLLLINGSMPKKNSVICIKSLNFTIVNSSERRIENIRISLPVNESSES
jgi:gliding motility-associated protein GldE